MTIGPRFNPLENPLSHFNNPLLAVAPPGRLGTLVVYDHQTPQIILAKLLGRDPHHPPRGPPSQSHGSE
jgi:hypothetical protein